MDHDAIVEPLILSLQMDEKSFARLNRLRRQYFPLERNTVPAHVTLFHALPGTKLAAISERLERLCATTQPFAVDVIGLRQLGRGVAYSLASPKLIEIRQNLAQDWVCWLTLQDRQAWRPHITVQNKVAAAVARTLYEELNEELTVNFVPFRIEAKGLLLWRYEGGLWSLLRSFAFGDAKPQRSS